MFTVYRSISETSQAKDYGWASTLGFSRQADFFGFMKLMGADDKHIELFTEKGQVTFLSVNKDDKPVRHFYTTNRELCHFESDQETINQQRAHETINSLVSQKKYTQ